ncbi:MAG TPA: FMN-binding negative transcriptional regulator, partial [Roseococcus sp.]|nr:FMN-binding negative transcriptional regulator [Roseococcus sp.]
GPVEIIEDAQRLHAIVDELTRHHEGSRERPWAVSDAPEPFIAGQLKGIVGFVLTIESLIGKRKLSQNRSEADRAGVVAQAEPALAAAMRE